MLRWNVVARAISKWGRYGFGFALAAVIWLQPATARAVLMNYTGTFSISVEGFSASSQPFHGTADVNLATGAFQILSSVSTLSSGSGTWTMSDVRINPPVAMSTTPSGTHTVTVSHPITQHPMLSVGGYAQGWLRFAGAAMLPAGISWVPNDFSFYPGGGFGGGFGGNGFIALPADLGATFYGLPHPTLTYLHTREARITDVVSFLGITSIFLGTDGSTYWTSGMASASLFYEFSEPYDNWTANDASFTIDGRLYTAPGSDNRNTTNRTGQLLLVTPIRIYAGMPNGGIGGYFNLDLNFSAVPEPGTAVLLGAGLVSLALAGRRKRVN